MLQAHGFSPRSHEARAGSVFAALERAGGRRMEPRVAARWTHPHRPADSLAAWEGKAGLAGIEVPDEVKARVLADLRAWATAEYGDLNAPREQAESFDLDAIRVVIG
jgi:hypothetical protein